MKEAANSWLHSTQLRVTGAGSFSALCGHKSMKLVRGQDLWHIVSCTGSGSAYVGGVGSKVRICCGAGKKGQHVKLFCNESTTRRNEYTGKAGKGVDEKARTASGTCDKKRDLPGICVQELRVRFGALGVMGEPIGSLLSSNKMALQVALVTLQECWSEKTQTVSAE